MSGGLGARLAQLIPKAEHGLTVLSIDGRRLKLLHATGRPSAKTVANVLAQSIDGQSDEDIAAWLRQACKTAGIEPRAVLIANPSHLTTTRVFTLPSTDPVEIRDIVALQAEKHTPYTKEEILTDFRIIETDRAGYSRVLLVLSHQDIVHRALRLVEAMGWPLERVGFELEGLVGWLALAKPELPAGVALVAELDADTTTLVAVRGQQPYFHRSLALGAAQLAQHPAEGAAKLLAEFQRSLETFDAEGTNLTIAGVVLTGCAERFPELKDRLHEGLDLPVTVVPAMAGVTMPEGAPAPAEPTSFASLAGLALQPSTIDLTPKALRLHRAFEARAKAVVGLACQAIGCLLLVACLIIGKALQNERTYARLHVEHQFLGEEVSAMESRLSQLALVEDWLAGRAQLLEALAGMAQRTPGAIRWDTLSYTKNEQIALKGVSEEIPKVYDFAAELRGSGLFTQVESRRVAKRKVNDKDVTEFELVCSLKSPEDADAGAEARADR
jgi:Tfp pilus assembly PilM family ATPase